MYPKGFANSSNYINKGDTHKQTLLHHINEIIKPHDVILF